jgi:hypothetical protein
MPSITEISSSTNVRIHFEEEGSTKFHDPKVFEWLTKGKRGVNINENNNGSTNTKENIITNITDITITNNVDISIPGICWI